MPQSSFDPSKLSPTRRAAAVHIGAQYSSRDTTRQADLTLQGFARHGTDIATFGYNQEDADELSMLRDALVKAGVGRQGARTVKKQTSVALQQALRAGKSARLRAHTVLDRALQRLVDVDLARTDGLRGVLTRTRSAQSDAQLLHDQLVTLAAALEDKPVADALKKRGGPEALAALKKAMTDLNQAREAHPGRPGTTAETELMDLLDGLIVENVRDARRAGRAAARVLGRAELAAAFELTALYGTKKRSGRDEEPATPPTPPEPAPVTQ